MSTENSFPSLEGFEPTRQTLHRYSNILGVVPRAHGEFHPKWWHISLKAEPDGLTTDEIALPTGGTLVLKNDEAIEFGESVLIYRGLATDRGFEVDVIIPAFDPHSPFPYSFTVAEARKGFKLVNWSFRLLSATPSFLHLEQVLE